MDKFKSINHSIVDKNVEKIKQYCAYQERSHFEVREKLYSLGMYKAQVETILTQLIADDYLNEERFACSFARGKFKLKQWGRIKIIHALKQKKVSEYNLKTALKEINEEDYMIVLQQAAAKKWQMVDGENNITRQAKTSAYLLQKGFEPALI